MQIDDVSIVADMMTIFRSGRRICWHWRVRANAKSELMLRSWNSSKITTDTPSSKGSAMSIRVRIPSVITSMRVDSDTRFSKRTL